MARLFSYQDGTFSGVTTWKTIDTTSYLQSVANTTATTTSFVGSSNFTPGAITAEGIIMFMPSRSASPTGTLEVQLWNATGSVQVALVTCNVSDISNNNPTYMYFKFAAPVVLLAATAYQVRVRSTTASQVTFYRDGTVNNWSRALVTSTIATAVAGDSFFVMGETTAPATKTTRTLTMDINSTSNYAFLAMGEGGVVNFTTSANTELRLNTEYITGQNHGVVISGNSILNQGTIATPIGSGFTSTLRLEAPTAGTLGIATYGSSQFNRAGQPKTKYATLATTIAAGVTSLTANTTPTNWLNGDEIVITGTRRAVNQVDRRTLNANVVSTTVTWTTNSSFAHDGAAGCLVADDYTEGNVAAHIANISRNCILRGGAVSTTNAMFVGLAGNSVLNWKDASYFNAGSSARPGISLAVGTVSLTIDGCSIYDLTNTSASCINYAFTPLLTTPISVTNSSFFNFNLYGVSFTNGSDPTGTVTKNVVNDNFFCSQINGGAAGAIVSYLHPMEVKRNVLTDIRTGSGYSLQLTNTGFVGKRDSYSVDENIIYSCFNGPHLGLVNNKFTGETCSGNVVFRTTNSAGIFAGFRSSIVTGLRLFGNIAAAILGTPSQAENRDLEFINCTFNGETGYNQPAAFTLSNAASAAGCNYSKATFVNCVFGQASGNKLAHTLADISFTTADTSVVQEIDLEFDDCNLASTTPLLNQTRMGKESSIKFRNFGQVANAHRAYYKTGILTLDTVITKSSPRSARFTPNSTEFKSEACQTKAAIKATKTAVVSAWVRTSVVGDGAAYNGSLPRLIQKRNYSLGVTSDVVLATATVASSGAWELIQGTTAAASEDGVYTFYLDCDGTTGWVNFDDIKVK